ncbi:MAG: DUF411 domain-containing protein [Gemmatimonadota bacterium]
MNRTIQTAFLVLGVASLSAGCDDRANREIPPEARAAAADPMEQGRPEADPLPVAELVTVYKSATCGCCKSWVAHMEAAGFTVEAHDVDDLPAVKVEHGVRPEHQSCHTALVGDYVVEGHVPADVVRRMLEERPEIAGLAAPGMPRGSPGMEVPSGEKDAYDVIAFRADGTSEVYATP